MTASVRWRPAPGEERRGPGSRWRQRKTIEYLLTRDRAALLAFLGPRRVGRTTRAERRAMVRAMLMATNAIRGYHTLGEMLTVAGAILERGAGGVHPVVVEAGSAYGASTAKLSLAVAAAGGTLHVFDSFTGIPDNDEVHEHLDGRPAVFRRGAFRGRLPKVREAVERWGAPEVVTFHKGLFVDTMAELPGRIDVAVLDVDLLASTRTCLLAMMPRMARDGVLFSLDGQLRATHELLADAHFWRDQVGIEPPRIQGLGRDKMLVLQAGPAG
jgi:O-methyltransferase